MPGPRHRWYVFAAMSAVYFAFGIAVAAIAPMLTLVRDDLGVSRGAMGFALGAWAMIYIATSPIAGRFIDRFGLGWSLALGGVSVGGSLVLRAAAQGLGTLWLAVAFFGVFGPLVSASAPKLMAVWFPDDRERRRGVGWYAMAPAIGGTVTVAVTNPVLLVWFDSWRSVLLFEAGWPPWRRSRGSRPGTWSSSPIPSRRERREATRRAPGGGNSSAPGRSS